MNFQPILFITGLFLSALSFGMIAPAIVDLLHHDINWQAFTLSAAITAFCGLLLTFANRSNGKIELSVKDTFLLTAVTWIVVSCFAALPFIFSNSTNSHTDSFFEAISGLTTTGASVIRGIDFASPGIVLWRAILQWIGGIGIVVMAFTVLPALKIGGMQLIHREFSDRSEKILPRVTQVASALLATYFGLTALCAFLLILAGMSPLEGVCHAFTTVATGGFSTSDSSVAYFNNPLIEAIMIIFMIIGGTTLILIIRVFQGNGKALWLDSQVRAFLALTLITTLILTFWRWHQGVHFLTAFREASFNITSIITTTGFSSTDYTFWGTFPLMIFYLLMMVGGCTGSTSGSIKIFRYQIMLAVAKAHMHQLRRPHGVFLPQFNKKRIPESVFTSVFTYFGMYVLTLGGMILGLALFDLDIATCLSGATSAINNIGPGFGPIIGPDGSFAPLPDGAKWLLMLGMILGRLEYITILVLFFPSFWRD